jgi:hypothetical protein
MVTGEGGQFEFDVTQRGVGAENNRRGPTCIRPIITHTNLNTQGHRATRVVWSCGPQFQFYSLRGFPATCAEVAPDRLTFEEGRLCACV